MLEKSSFWSKIRLKLTLMLPFLIKKSPSTMSHPNSTKIISGHYNFLIKYSTYQHSIKWRSAFSESRFIHNVLNMMQLKLLWS
jgi:hypothetical protein